MLRRTLPAPPDGLDSRDFDDPQSAFGDWPAPHAAAVRGAPRGPTTRTDATIAILALAWVGGMAAVLAALSQGSTGTAAAVAVAFGVLAALATMTVSVRAGAIVTAIGLVLIGAMAATPHSGWGLAALDGSAWARAGQTLLHATAVLAGLAGGWLLTRALWRAEREGAERERRFVGLLAIAADSYWEMGPGFAITHLSHRRSDGSFKAETPAWNRPAWEIANLLFDDELLDAHRADLEARRSFRDLPVRWSDANGAVRQLHVSGEPRFDARGAFVGYWGVTRDVTADVEARRALHASESRYRELFHRLPTALVLHRRGRILEANAAAAALFGYRDTGSMIGRSIEPHYRSSESRELLRERLARLNDMPAGGSLEPCHFELVGADGTQVDVEATGVQVDTERGPATLSIYLDETERRHAEDALRRSEALLSHLVATTPDLITLTDVATGRYVMVNEAFARLTGWPTAEVVGRTSIELGVWHDLADRKRLIDDLRRDGAVRDRPVHFVTRTGRPLLMRVSVARFVMDGHEYMVLNGRDVTSAERDRLEREAILEHASIGIAMTRGRRFQMANQAFEQMLGWPAGEIVGQPGRVVWPSDEAYAAIGTVYGSALARGERVEIHVELARRDGSTFSCRMLACAVDPAHPSRSGTIWIAEDVTEQRRMAQALAQARDAAEAASRAKSAFLANTSHEIRTPLNGLVGLARLARQSGVSELQRRHYLDQISDSAQTLSAIISDILDLSKIEAGKLHVEAVPFDLRSMLHTISRGYGALADGRGIALSLDIAPDLPAGVTGDPVRVRQIISNYIGNALKFTARGSVRLTAAPLPGGLVRFEVHDTGPGIDEATQARLFHPFTQADESTTRRYGGTGLGLSICRELARLMGGEVGLNSRVGEGSCFWVELPLPATAARPDADDTVPLRDGPPLAGLRVLVVEDNPVNMLIAVALLEQWGIEVGQAENGRDAVAAVEEAESRSQPYDIVLMDVQMPVMGGHDATRLLRRRHDAERLPIVALTAAALVSERDEALANGMNDFVTKPIDAQRLRSVLERLTRHRGA